MDSISSPAPDDSPSRTLTGTPLQQTRLRLSCYLLGSNASWMLLAFIFVQTSTYHRLSQRKPDPHYLRIMVYGLVLLQTGEAALDSLSAYRVFLYGRGDPSIYSNDLVGSVAANLLPLTDAFTGSVVQYFYIVKIRDLGRTLFGCRTRSLAKYVSIIVLILPLLPCAAAMIFVIVVTPAPELTDFVFSVINITSATWVISAAVIDSAITICMIVILYRAKKASRFSVLQYRFSKILRAVLQTGFVTTILAIACVSLLLGGESVPQLRDFFGLPWYFQGKSYVISFLSVLNARTPEAVATMHGDETIPRLEFGLGPIPNRRLSKLLHTSGVPETSCGDDH